MAGRGQVKALDSSVARLGSEVIPKLTSLRERILLQSQDHVIKSLFSVSFVASLTHWSHLSNCNLLPMQDYKRSAGSDLLSIHSECALEMSTKNSGNQKINSINICYCCCPALQIHQKQKQHRDCSVFSEQRGRGGGAEEQRSSSENTVQEESQLFSGPRIRDEKKKKYWSQTRAGALWLQIRQFHTDSSCLHVYIQSHQSKGQRRGGGARSG